MGRIRVATLVAAALMLVPASGAQAKPKHHDHGSEQLEKAVSVRNIVKHQAALQHIADMNGGTRYTKTPGFTASVAYVRERMKRAGLNTKVVQFDMPDWEEHAAPVLEQLTPNAKPYVAGSAEDNGNPAVDFIAFAYSPTKAVASAAVVPTTDIVLPGTAPNTSGCEPGDFPAATAGAISLIQRGTCGIPNKLANAQAAGAIGAIMFNQGDTPAPARSAALFRAGPTDLNIPAVFSSTAVGQELYTAYTDGKNPTVRLETSGETIPHFYPQVVAETKTGDPRHLVLAGAHLDSVPAGPGINDDGSGSAWQLALAEQLAKRKFAPRNKVRFLWFGGEEDGLVGSQYYARNLSQAEVDKVDVMIDTDMIASANYARLIYDGDGSEPGGTPGPDGSGTIENLFARYFARRGMATERIPFDGRSDYVGFVNRGIPSGGIFAGAEAPKTAAQVALYGGVAGEQLDPCYHEDCDNLATGTGQPPASTMNTFAANPALAQQQADSLRGNALKSLREMSGAVTHSVWYFGQNRRSVGSRTAADEQRAQQRAAKFPFRGHPRDAR